MRWFPIKSRLQHQYGRSRFAKLNTWHARAEAAAPPDTMVYTHHTPAWKHINALDPDFGKDPRHLHFGMAMDGVNPYSLMKSKHSTWPVLLINYNIPPWIAIKRAHVMLTVIIPGKTLSIHVYFDLLCTYICSIYVMIFTNKE